MEEERDVGPEIPNLSTPNDVAVLG